MDRFWEVRELQAAEFCTLFLPNHSVVYVCPIAHDAALSHAFTVAVCSTAVCPAGSRLVVLPAATLTKLFIGNIHRRVDAATIHEAIAAVEPVSAIAL